MKKTANMNKKARLQMKKKEAALVSQLLSFANESLEKAMELEAERKYKFAWLELNETIKYLRREMQNVSDVSLLEAKQDELIHQLRLIEFSIY